MELSNKTLALCQIGDRAAQHTLYMTYAPRMYGVCLRYFPDTSIAQDILQDGFIKVFDSIKNFRSSGSLEGWIRKIIVNTALDYHRKKEYHTSIDNTEAKSKLLVEDVYLADYHFLLSLIRSLPDQYRLVFNLFAIEGHSHAEIAQLLSITVSTSKSNYSRARSILRKKLELINEMCHHEVL